MTTPAQDLIILAVGLKPKAGPNTGVLPPRFKFGLRGAELVGLAMAGCVTVGNGRIEVRDPTPLADEASNAALSKLVASGGADVGQWMVNMPPMHVTYHFELLRAAGALSPVQVRLLLIAKRTGYLVVDQAYFRDVRARLHAAVTSPGPIDESQAALAGVVYAAGLARFAYPGSANTAQRDRLEQLAGGSPASRAATAAGTGTRGPSIDNDPNRFTESGGPAGASGGAEAAKIEAAVKSATEAAVHAVVSSITAAVHSASDAGTHSHHGGGSGSPDSSPSHHH